MLWKGYEEDFALLVQSPVSNSTTTMLRKISLLLILLAVVGVAGLRAAEPATGQYRVFLPALGSSGPRGLLGVEFSAGDSVHNVAELGPGWVRRNALRWSEIEPVRGAGYRWNTPSVRALERQLVEASQRDLRAILVVHSSPHWAVTPYGADCAPINAEFYDDYVRFLSEAVRRYSGPPYNVRFWELGNEPDAYVFSSDAVFGCWGQPEQELYGGQAYGELLKRAYPAVKAIAPKAQVLNGGLLLDEPYVASTDAGRSARFLEGMLEVGAGNSFDILAFHSYSFYAGTPDGTTGSVDWKPGYLRNLLARYGLSKPLFNTEGALLCVEVSDACRNAQAHAIGRLYVRALRDELMGFVWYLYSGDGFHNTSLVDVALPGGRRPAYAAHRQATTALAGYSYGAAVSGLPSGVEGHRLVRSGEAQIVLWANSVTPVALSIGAASNLRCADWNGQSIACSVDATGRLKLDAHPGPRYITWATP